MDFQKLPVNYRSVPKRWQWRCFIHGSCTGITTWRRIDPAVLHSLELLRESEFTRPELLQYNITCKIAQNGIVISVNVSFVYSWTDLVTVLINFALFFTSLSHLLLHIIDVFLILNVYNGNINERFKYFCRDTFRDVEKQNGVKTFRHVWLTWA